MVYALQDQEAKTVATVLVREFVCRFGVWLCTPQKKKGLSPKFQRYWKGPFTVVKRINDLVYKIMSGLHSKPNTVHRNRLREYIGPNPQNWLKMSAPAEHGLPVEQQPKMKEVIQRQTDDRIISDVEPLSISEEGAPEQSLLRRSKRQRRPPDRLGLMCNKNS